MPKGNLTSISGPEGFSNSFTYNERGWQLTATDANSNVTKTTYNDNGTTASIMDAAGYTQRFGYDGYGNITSAQMAVAIPQAISTMPTIVLRNRQMLWATVPS